MSNFRKNSWTSPEHLENINVVPFVDVLMVLLVIFMVTAPVISHTLDVQLPTANLSPGTKIDQTLIISLDQRGIVALNDTVIGLLSEKNSADRFDREIREWRSRYPGNSAFLRADRRIIYARIIQVMARLRELGVVDVGMMIERGG